MNTVDVRALEELVRRLKKHGIELDDLIFIFLEKVAFRELVSDRNMRIDDLVSKILERIGDLSSRF